MPDTKEWWQSLGYVPPYHNETAIIYGNRLLKRLPAIPALTPVQMARIRYVYSEKDSGNRMELYKKQRKIIERNLTGKGRHVDTWI